MSLQTNRKLLLLAAAGARNNSLTLPTPVPGTTYPTQPQDEDEQGSMTVTAALLSLQARPTVLPSELDFISRSYVNGVAVTLPGDPEITAPVVGGDTLVVYLYSDANNLPETYQGTVTILLYGAGAPELFPGVVTYEITEPAISIVSEVELNIADDVTFGGLGLQFDSVAALDYNEGEARTLTLTITAADATVTTLTFTLIFVQARYDSTFTAPLGYAARDKVDVDVLDAIYDLPSPNAVTNSYLEADPLSYVPTNPGAYSITSNTIAPFEINYNVTYAPGPRALSTSSFSNIAAMEAAFADAAGLNPGDIVVTGGFTDPVVPSQSYQQEVVVDTITPGWTHILIEETPLTADDFINTYQSLTPAANLVQNVLSGTPGGCSLSLLGPVCVFIWGANPGNNRDEIRQVSFYAISRATVITTKRVNYIDPVEPQIPGLEPEIIALIEFQIQLEDELFDALVQRAPSNATEFQEFIDENPDFASLDVAASTFVDIPTPPALSDLEPGDVQTVEVYDVQAGTFVTMEIDRRLGLGDYVKIGLAVYGTITGINSVLSVGALIGRFGLSTIASQAPLALLGGISGGWRIFRGLETLGNIGNLGTPVTQEYFIPSASDVQFPVAPAPAPDSSGVAQPTAVPPRSVQGFDLPPIP